MPTKLITLEQLETYTNSVIKPGLDRIVTIEQTQNDTTNSIIAMNRTIQSLQSRIEALENP